MTREPVRIAGAGVSGLMSAIQLARSGLQVQVFEERADSGRAHGLRCDAIENWSFGGDFADELGAWDLDTAPFQGVPAIDLRTFDGACHRVAGGRPLLYLVMRGNAPHCLEAVLKEKALALGVEIRYRHTLARGDADVWAVGCRGRGRFLDVALTFPASLSNRAVVLFDRRIAPDALAYLLVLDGTATVAVLLTRGMRSARARLASAVDVFGEREGFDAHAARISSGFGGSLPASNTAPAAALAVGEAAGLLDYLWGFGIRQALRSGALAAQSLVEGSSYDKLVATEIAPLVQCSLVNRAFYGLGGNRLDRALVRRFCRHGDVGDLLRRSYRSGGIRRRLAPWLGRSLGGVSR